MNATLCAALGTLLGFCACAGPRLIDHESRESVRIIGGAVTIDTGDEALKAGFVRGTVSLRVVRDFSIAYVNDDGSERVEPDPKRSPREGSGPAAFARLEALVTIGEDLRTVPLIADAMGGFELPLAPFRVEVMTKEPAIKDVSIRIACVEFDRQRVAWSAPGCTLPVTAFHTLQEP